MDDQAHTICLNEKETCIPDSILVTCKYCSSNVWTELGEIDKIPACIPCAVDLIIENKIKITTQFNKADLKKLFQFLLQKRRKEVKRSKGGSDGRDQ